MNTTCTTDFMGHFTCSEEISRAVTIFIEPSVKKKKKTTVTEYIIGVNSVNYIVLLY